MTLRYHKSHFIDGGRPRPRVGVVFPVRLLFAVVIGLGCRAAVTLALAAPARGAQLDTPAVFVRALGAEAVRALRDPALSEAERHAQLSQVFRRGLDFHTIGRLVLGRYWHRASREEKRQFAPLFEEYLIAAYVTRLARYRAGTFVVGRTTSDSNGDAVVGTMIGSPGGLPPASTGVFAGRPALTRSSMSSWRASAWWSPRDPNSPR